MKKPRRKVRAKRRVKKKVPPLFIVSKLKQSMDVQDGGKADIQIMCPVCHAYWADATVVFGGHITPEAFRLREPFIGKFIVKAGKPLTCPACSFSYTNWAVMACIIASENKRRIAGSIDSGFKSFGG